MLIAQITDTHIGCSGEQSRYLLDAVSWINAMRPRPDAILFSGDLVNNGRAEQYAEFRTIVAGSDAPCFIVPGNHDRLGPLRTVLPAALYPGVTGAHLHYTIDNLPVRIIGLDTTKADRLGGSLDRASAGWLEDRLQAAPARPTLLFMHHPPFRTGVNAADLFGFPGLRSLRRIIARYPAVRRIIAGHIHCERRALIAHALATTSISSIPQRVPELFERHLIALRSEPAGFALHAWTNEAFVSTTYVHAGGGRFIER